jgi:hypothetical protein
MHVACMVDVTKEYKVLVEKFIEKKPFIWPTHRLEDNANTDHNKSVGII